MTRIAEAGFTLIELLVVIALVTILMGAVSTSVAKAQMRAKIARATTECREITNAILAYENYDENHALPTGFEGGKEATSGNLSFILGEGGKSASGGKIPVLYNGALVNGSILDPWGTPYRVTIKAADLEDADKTDTTAKTMDISVFVPNFTRLSRGERGL